MKDSADCNLVMFATLLAKQHDGQYIAKLADFGMAFDGSASASTASATSSNKGAPPAFARKFVVSHAWASEFHPSPTGQTMRFLAAELDRLNADDDDCVFLECVSEASNPVESLCKPFSCALASLSVDQTFESRVWQLLLASATSVHRA